MSVARKGAKRQGSLTAPFGFSEDGPIGDPPTMVREASAFLSESDDHRHAARRVRDEIAALPGQEKAVALLSQFARVRAPVLSS